MYWDRKCAYEGPRFAALAIFIIFIGIYLAERRHDQIVASFVGGGIAAAFGFFQLGRVARPRLRSLWTILALYGLPSAVLILALLLRPRLPAVLSAGCFVVAIILLARETRERMVGD